MDPILLFVLLMLAVGFGFIFGRAYGKVEATHVLLTMQTNTKKALNAVCDELKKRDIDALAFFREVNKNLKSDGIEVV